MTYLLDTCVLSELIKRKPNPKIIQWIEQQDELSLYLSVLTIGEIEKGIAKVPDAKKKKLLNRWLHVELIARFQGRILLVDTHAAILWGTLCSRAELNGKPLPAIDSLLVAVALANKSTLVTRNVGDFKIEGLSVFNPW